MIPPEIRAPTEEGMIYYVNKKAQENGDHEVHESGCMYLPPTENLQHLGDFSNCKEAVEKAKGYFLQSNGCYWCSKECRTFQLLQNH